MIRIYAIDMKTGEREEITDLYWFEENGYHWFDDSQEDDGIHYHDYDFEILIDGVMVYRSNN